MSLSEVVNVNVNVETSAVSRAAFGTQLHLGLHKVFTERFRKYTTVKGLTDDGFAATSVEVAVATAVFSQDITPTSILIGRRQTDQTVITIVTLANNTLYSVTVDGAKADFTSDASATAGEVSAGLKIAIDALSKPVTVVDDLAGKLTINPTVSDTPYSVSVTANLLNTPDLAGAETHTIAISAIRDVEDSWYALSASSHLVADIAEIAAVVETLKKIYVYSTDEAAAITSATTDIFSTLSALNFDRACGIFDPDADTAYPEAALLGVMLPKDPGSATWAFKTLVGQDADALTPTESSNARGKNGNTYETLGGVDVIRFGTSAEGEFMDIIRGVDWLESRLQERIFAKLVAADKIPYTEQGVAIIEAEIRGQLREAIDAGVIAADPKFVITTPVVADITSVVKATRALPTITFTATLEGAIHKTTITGSVNV